MTARLNGASPGGFGLTGVVLVALGWAGAKGPHAEQLLCSPAEGNGDGLGRSSGWIWWDHMAGEGSGQRHRPGTCCWERHSLHRAGLGGSRCSRSEGSSAGAPAEAGIASSASRIALFNHNQMCSLCALFSSPFSSLKLS